MKLSVEICNKKRQIKQKIQNYEKEKLKEMDFWEN